MKWTPKLQQSGGRTPRKIKKRLKKVSERVGASDPWCISHSFDPQSPDSWAQLYLQFASRSSVDVFCWPGHPEEEAAAFIVGTSAIHDQGRRLFRGWALVLPNTGQLSAEGIRARLRANLRSHLLTRTSPKVVDSNIDAILARTNIVVLETAEASDLLRQVQLIAPQTAVFVLDAQTFSAERRITSESQARTSIAEDDWVPTVCELAALLGPVVEHQELYVALKTERPGPIRPDNRTLLNNVKGNVIESHPNEDTRTVLSAAINDWIPAIESGRVSDVLQSIRGSQLSSLNRASLKAQALWLAGSRELAYFSIRPHLPELLEQSDPQLLISAARMAIQAGRPEDAKALVRTAIRLGRHPESVLVALRNASEHLGLEDETAKLSEALLTRYPNSDGAVRETIQPFLRSYDFAGLESFLTRYVHPKSSPYVMYLDLLARTFRSDELPDYADFIRRADAILGGKQGVATLDAVRDLARRGSLREAILLMAGEDWTSELTEDAMALLERLIGLELGSPRSLGDSEKVRQSAQGAAQVGLLKMLEHVARRTGDGERRTRLTRLLSAGRSGTLGVSVLVERVATSGLAVSDEDFAPAETSSINDESSVALRHLLEENPPQILGVGRLSHETLGGDAQNLKVTLRALLVISAERAEDSTDAAVLLGLLHLGLLLDNLEPSPYYDLDLFRCAVNGLGILGAHQHARDLAERCLQLADGQDDARMRIAWGIFADAYLRAKNTREALVGLACARSLPVAIRTDFALAESSLVARVFRDLGPSFSTSALSAIDELRGVCAKAALEKSNRHIPDFLESTVRLQLGAMAIATGDASGPALMADVLSLLGSLVEEALTHGREIAPPVVLLAQAVSWSDSARIYVSAEIRSVLSRAIPLLSRDKRLLVLAFSNSPPEFSVDSTASSCLGVVRFAQDLASDISIQRMLARRALLSASDGTAGQTAFSIEWLADHSIRNADEHLIEQDAEALDAEVVGLLKRPNLNQVLEDPVLTASLQAQATTLEARRKVTMETSQPRLPVSQASVLQFLEEASRELDVHLLGLDTEDRLVRVTANRARLSVVVEREDVFDITSYRHWRRKYPYEYGKMDTRAPSGLNEVEHSLKRIGISSSEAAASRSLVVLDSEIQDLPANLFLVGDQLGGLGATATVPSLSWLQATRKLTPRSTGRRTCWVSRELQTSGAPVALPYLAAAIADPCRQYGFTVFGGAAPPDELRDADVAIVGAHGALGFGDRFFRSVRDESTTVLASEELASCLKLTRLAVLFVCSGGRVESDFIGPVSIGLPSALLDGGCRAVVAAPWSLEVSVPKHWLPEFMKALDEGETVMEANQRANSQVALRLGDHPARRLALHVFGDGMFRVSSPAK